MPIDSHIPGPGASYAEREHWGRNADARRAEIEWEKYKKTKAYKNQVKADKHALEVVRQNIGKEFPIMLGGNLFEIFAHGDHVDLKIRTIDGRVVRLTSSEGGWSGKVLGENIGK